MKRFFIAAIVALMASALPAQAQNREATAAAGPHYRPYAVAFYNLENLFDTINNNGSYDFEFSPAGARVWDGNKYWLKIGNLARAIAAMPTKATPDGPAIIGVSEIENKSVLDDLVKDPQIRNRHYKVIHHDSPDRRGVDVGMLYNPRMFRPLNVTNHTLKLNYPTRDQMCVVGLLGGDTVAVIVNHWPSRLGGEKRSSPNREAAAALSKAIADSVWAVHPTCDIMVMGDLNDDPHNKSVKEVLGARAKQEEVGNHGFFNPFHKMLDDGIGTLAYQGAWNLFDQIIISGNMLKHNLDGREGLYFLRAWVCNFDFLRQEGNGAPLRTYSGGAFLNGYSDHYPVQIILVKEI